MGPLAQTESHGKEDFRISWFVGNDRQGISAWYRIQLSLLSLREADEEAADRSSEAISGGIRGLGRRAILQMVEVTRF